MDFSKIIADAQRPPEGAVLPPADLFTPDSVRATPNVVEAVVGPEKVPGVVQYKLEYHCKRFVIGKELVAIDGQQKIFEDRDESPELCEVMNKRLLGEAVILNHKETFLQDGSVVVWLEWTENRPTAPTPKGVLTTEQLFSPERVTPRSKRLDAEQARSPFDTLEEDEDAGTGEEDSDPASDEADW